MRGRQHTPAQEVGQAAGDAIRARLLAEIPATERRLDLTGVPTAVLVAGDGPPVVLLHGAGQFAASWIRMIPRLASTHRVIAPDLPGHGASGLPDGRPDAERVLAWLAELVDATCPSPPVLVGKQAGGAIAARFSSADGHRVSALALVDAFGLHAFRPSPRFALAMVGFLARPTEHSRDRFLGQCVGDLEDLHDQMGTDWDLLAAYALERTRDPDVRTASRSLMNGFGVSALPAAALERIAVPTTLIWGRHDPAVDVAVAEAASARYGWPLRVIEDCGADPNLERPDALHDALRSVLTAA